MPMYDIYCPECNKEETVVCHHSERQCFKCETCDVVMRVRPSAANWKIKGYCAKGGYE